MDNKQETIRDDEPITIPYVVFRDLQTHNRWVVKWLVWALLAALVLLFGSNLAWLLVWNSYDFSGDVTTASVDSEGYGIANFTGGNGGVILGESDRYQTDVESDETQRELEGNSQTP